MDLFGSPVHDVFDHYASKRIIYERHYPLVGYFISISGSGACPAVVGAV